jgi:hypothetical protein
MSISRISAVLAFACLSAPIAAAAGVTLDGVPVPKAVSGLSVDVDVTEFRDGTDPSLCPRLIPGCAHPQVCLRTPLPVPVLDAQLAGAAPAHFLVGIEDGRSLQQCVLKSLNSEGPPGRRHYNYCLRCEGVSGP